MNERMIINEWANDFDYVSGAVISPDSKAMVTHHPHAIGIWELPSSRLVAKIVMDDLGYSDGIDDMAVDFAHGRLACWNGANVPGKRFLRVVDLATGQTIKSRKVEECIQSAAFDPGGKFLVTGESKGHRTPVRVWSADALKEVQAFEGHTNNVDYVAISPDGSLLATACFYREWQRLDDLYLWDLRAMRLKCRLTAPDGNFSGLYWSPDGTRLLAGLFKKAAVWEVDGFRRTDIGSLQYLSISSGDNYAAFLRYDGSGKDVVSIWSMRKMQVALETVWQGKGDVKRVSPDGTMFLSSSGRGEVAALCDAGSGLPIVQLPDMSPRAFGPNSDFILVEGKTTLALIRCPTGVEKDALLVEARRAEDDRVRQREEEKRRAEEERLRKQAEEQRVAEQERIRKTEEEKRLAEDENLRKQAAEQKEAEKKRICREVEEKRRDYETRKIAIKDSRRKAAQCVMCGQPLGWIDRLLRRDRHSSYESFSE